MCQLKVINARQGCIHKYENLKRKLYNCNANIYFNNVFKNNETQTTPEKNTHTSPAFKYTQYKVPNIRIKYEVKYIYNKKQHLNQQIYHLHMILANSWNNIWPRIQHKTEEKLKKAIGFIYKNLFKKVNQTDTRTN
jgi:asparagine N-glycosylation enzyme membrane subunit Stt3